MHGLIAPVRNHVFRHSVTIGDEIFRKLVGVVVGTDVIAIHIDK